MSEIGANSRASASRPRATVASVHDRPRSACSHSVARFGIADADPPRDLALFLGAEQRDLVDLFEVGLQRRVAGNGSIPVRARLGALVDPIGISAGATRFLEAVRRV